MTNTFWVAVAAMTALALAFVAYPLFFRSRAQQHRVDRHGENLNNYRVRLAELEAERNAGRLDDASFDTLKEELDASLLQDVDDFSPRNTAAGARSDRRAMFAVMLLALIVVPVTAFTLYERWGSSDALAQMALIEKLQRGGEASPEQVESLLSQLRAHLEQNPDNPDGWAMLGRTNMELGRYAQAASAYKRLAEALQGEPVAATAWGLVAQARYLDNGRQVDDAVNAAVTAALAADPDEVNALGLLGIAAFEREEYRAAAEHWARILRVAPDYPQYGSIANGIVNAYRQLQERPSDEVIALLRRAVERGQAAQAPAGPDSAETSVEVRVELSDDLPEPDADATVFVYARAVDGPPMPLAVVRLKAGELPATVTLDDSSAMTPQARLSNADQIVVGARISQSGSATPGKGDLEGSSAPIEVEDASETIAVTIDRQRL